MKKSTKIVIVICAISCLLAVGWVVARMTHILDIYTVSTTSNNPTLRTGQLFFASRLKTPDYGDFICYRSSQGSIFIHRLIGKPGDIIEIKDAVAYRNGAKLNEPYTWNQYLLSKNQYESIRGYVEDRDNQNGTNNDSAYITSLTDAEIVAYKLKVIKYITPKDTGEPTIESVYHQKNYNPDNFGPVKVPENSFFLLGDNRHDALDSRYAGFIKQVDYVSTMLSKR